MRSELTTLLAILVAIGLFGGQIALGFAHFPLALPSRIALVASAIAGIAVFVYHFLKRGWPYQLDSMEDYVRPVSFIISFAPTIIWCVIVWDLLRHLHTPVKAALTLIGCTACIFLGQIGIVDQPRRLALKQLLPGWLSFLSLLYAVLIIAITSVFAILGTANRVQLAGWSRIGLSAAASVSIILLAWGIMAEIANYANKDFPYATVIGIAFWGAENIIAVFALTTALVVSFDDHFTFSTASRLAGCAVTLGIALIALLEWIRVGYRGRRRMFISSDREDQFVKTIIICSATIGVVAIGGAIGIFWRSPAYSLSVTSQVILLASGLLAAAGSVPRLRGRRWEHKDLARFPAWILLVTVGSVLIWDCLGDMETSTKQAITFVFVLGVTLVALFRPTEGANGFTGSLYVIGLLTVGGMLASQWLSSLSSLGLDISSRIALTGAGLVAAVFCARGALGRHVNADEEREKMSLLVPVLAMLFVTASVGIWDCLGDLGFALKIGLSSVLSAICFVALTFVDHLEFFTSAD